MGSGDRNQREEHDGAAEQHIGEVAHQPARDAAPSLFLALQPSRGRLSLTHVPHLTTANFPDIQDSDETLPCDHGEVITWPETALNAQSAL